MSLESLFLAASASEARREMPPKGARSKLTLKNLFRVISAFCAGV